MDDGDRGIQHAPIGPGVKLGARDGIGAFAQVDHGGVDAAAGDLGKKGAAGGGVAHLPRENAGVDPRRKLLDVVQDDVRVAVFTIRTAPLNGNAPGHQFEAFTILGYGRGGRLLHGIGDVVPLAFPCSIFKVLFAPLVAMTKGEIGEHEGRERIIRGVVVDIDQAGEDDPAGVHVRHADNGDIGDGDNIVVAHMDGPVGAGTIGRHDQAAQGVFTDGPADKIIVEPGLDIVGCSKVEYQALEGGQRGVAGPDVAVGRARADQEVGGAVGGLPVDAAAVPIRVADGDVGDPDQDTFVGLVGDLVAPQGGQRYRLVGGQEAVGREVGQDGHRSPFLHGALDADAVTRIGAVERIDHINATPGPAGGIGQGIAGGIRIGGDASDRHLAADIGRSPVGRAVLDVGNRQGGGGKRSKETKHCG